MTTAVITPTRRRSLPILVFGTLAVAAAVAVIIVAFLAAGRAPAVVAPAHQQSTASIPCGSTPDACERQLDQAPVGALSHHLV